MPEPSSATPTTTEAFFDQQRVFADRIVASFDRALRTDDMLTAAEEVNAVIGDGAYGYAVVYALQDVNSRSLG